EDGIRDYKVTGVQTCALPISKKFQLAKAKSIASTSPPAAQRRHSLAPGVSPGVAGTLSRVPSGTALTNLRRGLHCAACPFRVNSYFRLEDPQTHPDPLHQMALEHSGAARHLGSLRGSGD